MATSANLNPTTTIFIGELNATPKTVVLTKNPDAYQEGRIVYVKASPSVFGQSPPPLTIDCAVGTQIYPGLSTRTLQEYHCVSLLEQPTNTYNLLSYYPGLLMQPNFEPPVPTSVAVNIPGDNSYLFVDLSSDSKALVLPPIFSLTNTNAKAPHFVIKDDKNNAAINNLYISTSGSATIDGIDSCLKLDINGCSIELLGDAALNRWHILNYYDGTL